MRIIKLILLAVILAALVLMAVANRAAMTINLLPEELAEFSPIGNSLTLPGFVILGAAILVGLLIGYLVEYLREHKHRREVGRKERKLDAVEAELEALRRKTGEHKDDVIALLN